MRPRESRTERTRAWPLALGAQVLTLSARLRYAHPHHGTIVTAEGLNPGDGVCTNCAIVRAGSGANL
jgi:hypothetical protein